MGGQRVAWQGRGLEHVGLWRQEKEKGTLNENPNRAEAGIPNTKEIQCKIVFHMTSRHLKIHSKKMISKIVSGGQGM